MTIRKKIPTNPGTSSKDKEHATLNSEKVQRIEIPVVTNLWFEASPYKAIGYKKGLAEGGHRTTDKTNDFSNNQQHKHTYTRLDV